MRRDPDEQRLALECLKLAQGDIAQAGKMLAFVTRDDAGTPTIAKATRAMASEGLIPSSDPAPRH